MDHSPSKQFNYFGSLTILHGTITTKRLSKVFGLVVSDKETFGTNLAWGPNL